MPLCTKCGTTLEEGSKFCPNCGAKVVVPKPPKIREAPDTVEGEFGLPDLLALIGAVALLVGPFLTWLDVTLGAIAQSVQGLELSKVAIDGGMSLAGPLMFVFGALSLVAVIISRNLGRISEMVYIGLALCALAIIGHFTYLINNSELIEWGDLAVGFYLAGAGAVLVLVGGVVRLLMKSE